MDKKEFEFNIWMMGWIKYTEIHWTPPEQAHEYARIFPGYIEFLTESHPILLQIRTNSKTPSKYWKQFYSYQRALKYLIQQAQHDNSI